MQGVVNPDLEATLPIQVFGPNGQMMEVAAVVFPESIADPTTRLDGNPYREWLAMYAGDEYQGLARDCRAALDEQFGRRGGEGRFSALTAAFTTATRLEAEFWQMGLRAAR